MKTLAASAVLVLLVVGVGTADEMTMPWGAVSNVGTSWAESWNYGVQFTAGGPCIGVGMTEAVEADAGFWFAVWTDQAPADYLGCPWSWIAVPFHPMVPKPSNVLGFDCDRILWRWDKYAKAAQVYRPPLLKWGVSVGDSYMTYLEHFPDPVRYSGFVPCRPFEFKTGRMGWTWLGMPRLHLLGGDEFMDTVLVQYPSDETGQIRTAREDWEAGGNAWLTWAWAWWDAYRQHPWYFTPYLPWNNTCYPWVGYRAWVNVGAAASEDDPDQVTLIWP